MSNVTFATETWIEQVQTEVIGFKWSCGYCGHTGYRLYSQESAKRESERHLEKEHKVYPEWKDITDAGRQD